MKIKKALCVSLACCSVLSLAACGEKEPSTTPLAANTFDEIVADLINGEESVYLIQEIESVSNRITQKTETRVETEKTFVSDVYFNNIAYKEYLVAESEVSYDLSYRPTPYIYVSLTLSEEAVWNRHLSSEKISYNQFMQGDTKLLEKFSNYYSAYPESFEGYIYKQASENQTEYDEAKEFDYSSLPNDGVYSLTDLQTLFSTKEKLSECTLSLEEPPRLIVSERKIASTLTRTYKVIE